MTRVYHYPNCSTCKKALQWLSQQGIAVEALHIVEQTPDAATLSAAIQRSGLPFRRFFNTSGQSYRQGGFSARIGDMSVEDAAAALAADGMLIKRPLVIANDFILVGFKEDEWASAFGVSA